MMKLVNQDPVHKKFPAARGHREVLGGNARLGLVTATVPQRRRKARLPNSVLSQLTQFQRVRGASRAAPIVATPIQH
jgi:hypothetical protein